MLSATERYTGIKARNQSNDT